MSKYLPYLFAGSWLLLSLCPNLHAQNAAFLKYDESQPVSEELVWQAWQPPGSSRTPPETAENQELSSQSANAQQESAQQESAQQESVQQESEQQESAQSAVDPQSTVNQTVKKSPYTQVQYTQVRPAYRRAQDETVGADDFDPDDSNRNGSNGAVQKNGSAAQNGVQSEPQYPPAAPSPAALSPATHSTQGGFVQYEYADQGVVQGQYQQAGYYGRPSRTVPNHNPSPEPFPGANYINHLPNTETHCRPHREIAAPCVETCCVDPCYDPCCNPCVDPCYDPCCNPCVDPCAAPVPGFGPYGYATPSLLGPQTHGPYLLGSQLFGHLGLLGYTPGAPLGDGSMFLTGWVNAGATFSPSDNNFPLRYNDRGNEFLMNQLYLSFGKSVNKNRPCIDLGARVDLLYGTDYFFTSSLGLETDTYWVDPAGNKHAAEDPTNAHQKWNDNHGDRGNASLYGLSMPQLYTELFLPIHHGFTAKFGHFYSIMGYESVMAPQNFFYSRTLTTTYGEPATHTGVLFSQQITPRLAFHGGVTRGWNVWDSDSDGVSGLLGVQWNTRLGSSLSFTLHTGKTASRSGDTRTNYSFVWIQPLNPTLKYVLQHDLGVESNGSYLLNGTEEIRSQATWISIAQYLECQWTPSLAGALRFEWFRDDGHSRILQFPTSTIYYNGVTSVQGNNYFNITLGAKWKPREFLTVRPEVRWDWSDAKILSTVPGTSSLRGVYDGFSHKNQCTASVDFIVMF